MTAPSERAEPALPTGPAGQADAEAFIRAMIERNVLKFGDFVLKSKRRSPYFFNLGAVADGAGLALLGDAYATQTMRLPQTPEVLFGPAYKGIAIAVATVISLARRHGLAVGAAHDRKEAKAHGEGGRLVGAELAGRRVAIVDDVVTDGAAKRQAFDTIVEAGGQIVGVVLALDRQEPAREGESETAVQALQRSFDVPVHCVASLDDVVRYLGRSGEHAKERKRILEHRRRHA